MASSSKKKTTFAKLNREAAVRERRQIKAARKAARKLEASQAPEEPVLETDGDEQPDAVDEPQESPAA